MADGVSVPSGFDRANQPGRMRVAVYANARTTVTALDAGEAGWTGSFNCAFQSGAIMGFSLCGPNPNLSL